MEQKQWKQFLNEGKKLVNEVGPRYSSGDELTILLADIAMEIFDNPGTTPPELLADNVKAILKHFAPKLRKFGINFNVNKITEKTINKFITDFEKTDQSADQDVVDPKYFKKIMKKWM